MQNQKWDKQKMEYAMSKILSFSNETLKDQIIKGKAWLKEKSQAVGTSLDLQGDPYDDEQWQFRLELYEKMVDEYKIRHLDPAIIMEDQEILDEEKKIREYLVVAQKENKKDREYEKKWKHWFNVRNEGIKRGLFRFLTPTQFDKEQ